jgi:hypothetical protein
MGKEGMDRPIAFGTAAARPAANMITPNSFYFALDTGAMSFSDGSTWTPVGGSAQFTTGDYKISAQTANHADPAGGTWYICDGSATVGAPLIALVGATLPDARGRALTMKGTHADVDAIGDNDGVTLASRRPKHNTSVLTNPTISRTVDTTMSDPGHSHGLPDVVYAGNQGAYSGTTTPYGNYPGYLGATNGQITGITLGQPQFGASGGAYGPGGTAATDQPSYVVPGNLFVHS